MKALILVDLQNDFCPGGALPVREGHHIVPLINGIHDKYDLVVATQDWHPKDHGSFATAHNKKPGEKILLNGIEQILWPDHCVQDTKGAEFIKTLEVKHIDKVFQKGTEKHIDSYSGFFDNGRKKDTGLGKYLKDKGVLDVHIVGLATDYCVKHTALDAVTLGFRTAVITDLCRGVDVVPGDIENAINAMRDAGIRIL